MHKYRKNIKHLLSKSVFYIKMSIDNNYTGKKNPQLADKTVTVDMYSL